MSLKDEILEDIKNAMRAKDKARLGVLRMITSAIKQKEVDERVELSHDDVMAILEKMIKQRRDAITQYEQGGRPELAEKENSEVQVIQQYMPEQLSDTEIDSILTAAIEETGASSMKDMGKLMGIIKPKVQGRADMKSVSAKVKEKLS